MKWIIYIVAALALIAVVSWLRYGRAIGQMQKAASTDWWGFLALLCTEDGWENSSEPIKDGTRILVDNVIPGHLIPHWVKYNGDLSFNTAVRKLLDRFYGRARR